MVEYDSDGPYPFTLSDLEEDKENLPSPLVDTIHGLQRNWTLWFFHNNRHRTWEENQAKVATFNTVEDFWALFNHIEQAGRLPVGCDYSVFKEDIVPAWEDERNRPGGRWLIQLDRNVLNSRSTDRYWMEILMMMIGEAFRRENRHICGAVVSLRARMDKIAVWINCDLNESSNEILKIGQIIKDRLRLGPRMLSYQTHSDMAVRTRGSGRITYYL